MPTPVYALRLPKKTQDDLVEMAKIYGAPNGRAFAREVLETVMSGDGARIAAFNRRLIAGMGEQLALKLNAPLEEMVDREAKQSGRDAQRINPGPSKAKVKGGRRARPRN